MGKNLLKKLLFGSLSIGLLTSCTFRFDLDLSQFSLENFITITETEAEEIIASFNPSDKYDDVNTIDFYSSEVDNSTYLNEETSLKLDDNLDSLSLSYSYKNGAETKTITLSKNDDGTYSLKENGETNVITEDEAYEYVVAYKKETIDVYAYSSDSYFYDLIENGTVKYYSLFGYIRFEGTYTSDNVYSTFDCAYTHDGLFVAGRILKYMNNEAYYEYLAAVDYNGEYTELVNLFI